MTVIILIAALAACPGVTTVEVDQCLAAGLAADQAMLDRYSGAARKRLATEHPATVAKFDAAQTAWADYRDKACAAVFDYWSGGTIRGAQTIACRRNLTRARTREIWRDWLTYADSTPPILPEPPAGE